MHKSGGHQRATLPKMLAGNQVMGLGYIITNETNIRALFSNLPELFICFLKSQQTLVPYTDVLIVLYRACETCFPG